MKGDVGGTAVEKEPLVEGSGEFLLGPQQTHHVGIFVQGPQHQQHCVLVSFHHGIETQVVG